MCRLLYKISEDKKSRNNKIYFAFVYLAYSLSQGKQLYGTLVDRGNPRDFDNPFYLPAFELRKVYRLTADLAEDLVSRLEIHLKISRIKAVSAEKQVYYFIITPIYLNIKH